MPSDRAAGGQRASDIGEIAESTLSDLIQLWLSDSGAPRPSSLDPDEHRVDLYVTLPGMWSGIGDIHIDVQVKSTSSALRPLTVAGIDGECLSYRVSAAELKKLQEAAKGRSHFFIALAVNHRKLSPRALLETVPAGRFQWFIIDFAQQFERLPEATSIYFPVQNELNLSTFSLLWSALWTERFHSPLIDPRLHAAPEIVNLIPRIFSSAKAVDDSLFGDWDFLTTYLPSFAGRFDAPYFADMVFKLGQGHALGIIENKIYASADRLDEIFCYCPESLYGTANLWLFARSYHGFMKAAGQVVPGRDGVNRRLLPLPGDVSSVPPVLAAALWHVALFYASMGVEVILVERPSSHAGDDHSFYGGGIDFFPWISLSPDGAAWTIAGSNEATTGHHLDFLHEAQSAEFLTLSSKTLFDVSVALDIPQEDIRTAASCPADLFPRQSEFLEYPNRIFGRDMSIAFNQIHRA